MTQDTGPHSAQTLSLNDSADVLNRYFKEGRPVYLSSGGIPFIIETQIVDMSPTSILLRNPVHFTLIQQVMDARAYSLQIGSWSLEFDQLLGDGLDFLVDTSKGQFMKRASRSEERVTFKSDEQVVCRFTNPHDGVTPIEKRVLDMSPSGLALQQDFQSHLFSPGQIFKDLRVDIKGEEYTRLSAEVIYSCSMISESGSKLFKIGLRTLADKQAQQIT